MSDLCYNCGDCHLPRPCAVALKYCEICGNLGHTYNFCPLSVRRKDPSYQFWALCHNCDKWHLPDPCPLPLHQCKGCDHHGHKEFFCPVKPLPRDIPSTQSKSTGVKRQRTSGSDVSDPGQVTPEMVQKIKNDAATYIFSMLNKGYNYQEIMRQFAPNMVLMGAANPTLGTIAHNGSGPNTPTPAPAQTYSSRTDSTPGLYSIMQDRFNRGDLKIGPTQDPVRRDSAQYAENVQTRNDTPTQDLRHHSGSHYAESFQSKHSNAQGSGDNINVGTATTLQELAQSAVTGAVSTDPTGSIVATAGTSMVDQPSQAQNFGDHLLAHAIATSVGGFNAGTPTTANAVPYQGFATANTGTPNLASPMPQPGYSTAVENMPGYQTHTVPSQPAEDSIAVGITEPEVPQLALRKDGKPRKRQPTRSQPPRKKAA